MTINYTTLLALAEPVTGTQPGVWGDDVNKGITDYLDIAIAGTNTLSTDADVTLTKTQGDNGGSNISATTAQYMQLLFNGARTAIRNVVAPATSKIYVVNNSTTGGFAVVVKTGVSTGVSIANGEKAVIAYNGSDYVKISSSLVSGLTGILPVANGGTGASTLTGVVYGNGTSAMTAASAAQIVAAIGATPVANATNVGNISGGSAGQLLYQTNTNVTGFAPAPTAGYVLSWTGTAFNWVVGVPSSTAASLAGGAAFQVPYQSAPSTTQFSPNFQFDGSFLRVGDVAPLTATNPIIAATGNQNLYIQSYIYNSNSGSSASADFVAYADNSTEASGWIDMSLTSSTYADANYTVIGPNEGSITMSAPSGAGKTGNLVYATDSTGTTNAHQWYVGGFTQAKSAYKMQLSSTSLTLNTPLSVTGGTGTAGFLLASTGSSTAPQWVDSTSIGVTNGKLYFFGQF